VTKQLGSRLLRFIEVSVGRAASLLLC